MYSKKWTQRGTATSYDILLNKEGLFLIKIPTSLVRNFGHVFGIIGMLIAEWREKQLAQAARGQWLGPHDEIVSEKYRENSAAFVPNNMMALCVMFKKKLLGGEYMVIKNNGVEFRVQNTKAIVESVKQELRPLM